MSDMQIKDSFRFHPVGQGLFYSGALTAEKTKKQFRFVYDCGTESKSSVLETEIEQFTRDCPDTTSSKPRLDWLVVSHFHDDHISGLPKLFDSFQVDAVSVPYMSQSYRELAKLEHKYRNVAIGVGGGASSDDAGGGDAMAEFFDNPSRWLAERGVKTVVFSGVSEGDLTPPEDPVTLVEDGESGFYLTIPSENVLGVRNVSYGATSIREVHLNNGMCQVLLKNPETVWEFFLDNLQPETDAKLQEYLEKVNGYLNTHSLRDFLCDDSERDILSEVISATLNRTSVVMLHRPAEKNVSHCYCDLRYLLRYCNCEDYRPKTLLTGDVTLKKRNDAAQLTSILGEACNCQVLQYPHHGSGKNDTERFCDLKAGVVVVPYGIGNKYKHPDNKVLEKYAEQGAVIRCVTQCQGEFGYELNVRYEEPEASEET